MDGAKLLQKISSEMGSDFRFEYSPESFTGTEMEFARDICNAVLDVWKPTPEKKVIINLPVTVEHSMPHVYACQVEYMCKHLDYRDSVVVSLHPHNDRGCGVADCELGLLEGTLFGNGERTGNADIVTLALNMFSQGVDPKLNFEDMPSTVALYEKVTGMHVYDRQPYGGKLVFAAFSGSHQDAIAKGMKWREEKECVIRINSQSGKGGIGYLLEQKYGFVLPPKMREDFGYAVKNVSDHQHKELQPEEVYEIFRREYLNINDKISLVDFHFVRNDCIHAAVTVKIGGVEKEIKGDGNGRLDAVSNAIKENLGIQYQDLTYTEHALEQGSKSRAAAYVGITGKDGRITWGVGVDSDIITASVKALFSAINRQERKKD